MPNSGEKARASALFRRFGRLAASRAWVRPYRIEMQPYTCKLESVVRTPRPPGAVSKLELLEPELLCLILHLMGGRRALSRSEV